MRHLLLTFLLSPICLFAQDGTFNLGAESNALSGASVTIDDKWSIFYNPGAMANVSESSAFVSYLNRYNLVGLHTIGGGIIMHKPKFNLGLKYFKFGDIYFNQEMVGMAIANRFQMVSIGAGVNLAQSHAEGLSTIRKVLFEMGGTAEITQKIIFGAHIYNFKHLSDYPTTMKVGLSFRPITTIMINTEIEKQPEQPSLFKTGLSYRLIDAVTVRTGIHIQSNNINNPNFGSSYGFGIILQTFELDYAFVSETLGSIHEISLSYKLRKNS